MNVQKKDLTKAEISRLLFRAGANCAQAVAVAFAEECRLEEETLSRLSSGFGAGIGCLREVCGAVSGIVLVANLLYGPSQYSDKAGKDAHYARIQTLLQRFKTETGSILCRELLGIEKKPKEIQQESSLSEDRTETYYRKRPCTEMVALAAEILENEIAQTK